MATGLDALAVVPFTRARVTEADPGGELPWQVYHAVRNALVETCRRFGPTGPMGVVTVTPDVQNPYHAALQDDSFWEPGDADPAYYLIPDQYNHERYCYAELYGDDPFTGDWLLATAETLRRFNGWGLGVKNVPGSYVPVFPDRLMVSGRPGAGRPPRWSRRPAVC